MPPIRKFVFLAALLALAAAAPSQSAPRKFAVGASESASLVPDAVLAKTRMDLAVLAGFNEIEVRAGDHCDRRSRRAARRRQRALRQTDPLADDVPTRPRRRVSQESAGQADHGHAGRPSIRRELEDAADGAAPEVDEHLDRRLPE